MSYMFLHVFHFSLRACSILIIVFNYWSDDFKTSVIYESGSDGSSSLQTVFLSFAMPCNFPLKVGLNRLSKKNR